MRIAHVSDLHAFSLEGVGALPFLTKRFAGLVNLRLHRREKHPPRLLDDLVEDLNREALDEIVVTGDLTNLALESEFRLARQLLDRLTLGPRHVTVVPGNHDVYTLDAVLRRPFHAFLSSYASSDSGDERFPFVRVRGGVAIVGASSARPSPVPFASGSLGSEQRHRLEERLSELGRRGLYRVLLIHHPPVDNRAAFFRGLRDRGALQDTLRRTGCELILHGHEHRDLLQRLSGPDGPIHVSGVGSASYDHALPARRARYHVYDIDAANHDRLSRRVRVHDPARGRFVAMD